MKQFINVLQFELMNYVKNKSFVITTIVFALILGIGLCIPSVIKIPGLNSSSGSSKDSKDTAELGIFFESDSISPSLEELQAEFPEHISFRSSENKEALKVLVENGEVKAGFLVQSPTMYTYIVKNNSFSDTNQTMFEDALAKIYRQNYLTSKGYNYEEINSLYENSIASSIEILGKDSVRNYAYTYILLFVLYLFILLYGSMIAVAVTTEKSNRAIEILVTSTSTNSLIFGKVIAGAIASIVQIGLVMSVGILSYQLNRGSWNYMLDFLFQIPPAVLITFALFGLLGYLFYAFIYGALGALVSKVEDINKSSGTITMIFMIAFFIAIFGMMRSDSLLIKISSYIPFTACTSMLVRVAMGTVSLYEIMISFIITSASTVLVGLLASKIYRFGTLMYGNPIKISTALKKIRESK